MGKSDAAHATVIRAPSKIDICGGVLVHEASGRRLKIDTSPRIIGRADCDLRIDDLSVSAAHCELVATAQGVRLRDLTSRNGTFIGETRIGEVFLTSPTRIQIGRTHLDFVPKDATPRVLPSAFGALQSSSPRMQGVFEQLNQIVRTSLNVHLTGESGTGKGYIARRIHEQSRRARKPFVTINLAEITPNLFESALFGHEKGSFSGATHATASPFIEADGGTLFLDEIGDLPLELQKKLLRVIDEKVIQRVGSTRVQRVDVRIISATLHNLREKVNRTDFRDDLFYRLGTRVELPALHERREDIPLLARQILDDFGHPELFDQIPQSTLAWMTSRTWEGNLRGLRLVLQAAIELHDEENPFDVEAAFRTSHGGSAMNASSLSAHSDASTPVESLIAQGSASVEVERAARGMLLTRLNAECEGVISEIARRACLSRKVVRDELASLGVRAPVKPWKRVARRQRP